MRRKVIGSIFGLLGIVTFFSSSVFAGNLDLQGTKTLSDGKSTQTVNGSYDASKGEIDSEIKEKLQNGANKKLISKMLGCGVTMYCYFTDNFVIYRTKTDNSTKEIEGGAITNGFANAYGQVGITNLKNEKTWIFPLYHTFTHVPYSSIYYMGYAKPIVPYLKKGNVYIIKIPLENGGYKYFMFNDKTGLTSTMVLPSHTYRYQPNWDGSSYQATASVNVTIQTLADGKQYIVVSDVEGRHDRNGTYAYWKGQVYNVDTFSYVASYYSSLNNALKYGGTLKYVKNIGFLKLPDLGKLVVSARGAGDYKIIKAKKIGDVEGKHILLIKYSWKNVLDPRDFPGGQGFTLFSVDSHGFKVLLKEKDDKSSLIKKLLVGNVNTYNINKTLDVCKPTSYGYQKCLIITPNNAQTGKITYRKIAINKGNVIIKLLKYNSGKPIGGQININGNNYPIIIKKLVTPVSNMSSITEIDNVAIDKKGNLAGIFMFQSGRRYFPFQCNKIHWINYIYKDGNSFIANGSYSAGMSYNGAEARYYLVKKAPITKRDYRIIDGKTLTVYNGVINLVDNSFNSTASLRKERRWYPYEYVAHYDYKVHENFNF